MLKLVQQCKPEDPLHAQTCTNLAWKLYHPTKGLKPNATEFECWGERAAQIGVLSRDDFGYHRLAEHYYDEYNRNNVFENIEKAIELLQKGIQSSKDGRCAEKLAELYRSAKGHIDHQKAAGCYKQAIAQGMDCYVFLGYLYLNDINDPSQAITWFAAGAERGDAFCFNAIVGVYSSEGQGCHNPAQAQNWLKRWQNKADLNKIDLKYLVPHLLSDPLMDVAMARQYADRLLAMKDAGINDQAATSGMLGKFLLVDERHRDILSALRYLQAAAGMACRFYYREPAFDLLADCYDEGKHGVQANSTLAAHWKAKREEARKGG